MFHFVVSKLNNSVSIARAVCPLTFKEPTEVINACWNVAAPSPSCCSSLNTYITGIQKQMLITNKQAIICATLFGSMLRGGGVMTNIYELCDVDLKDFSIQGIYHAQLIFLFPAHDHCLSFSGLILLLWIYMVLVRQLMDNKVCSFFLILAFC